MRCGKVERDFRVRKLIAMSKRKSETRNHARSWLVPLLIVASGMSGCEKARLDDEVRRLCAIDGGVKIYEKIVLPKDKFDKYGVFSIPRLSESNTESDYFFTYDVKYYVHGNPEMWRDHFQVIRRSDSKLLGEAISYSRRGGDLPGPWQSSSFSCPSDSDISSLKKKIFERADGR